MSKKALGSIIPAFFLYLLVDQYIFCPTYVFEVPKPFSGDSIYNPYDGFNSGEWTLANFHAHTSSWLGVTNGKGDAKDVYEGYDSMGYGIHLISEYQKINRYGDTGRNHINAYEQGYNLPKSHRLVIGARKVIWKDYFFPQTLSNKQDMLNRLTADTGTVIVLNHPAMRIGYSPADLKFLSNYDCMEVLNSYKVTFDYWDTALSNGKMVSIVGNDDTHNAGNRNAIGKFATLVHAPNGESKEVLRSLRMGRTIGVWIPHEKPIPFKEKSALLRKSGPAIESMRVDSGMLRLKFSANVYGLCLVGQGGRKMMETGETRELIYPIKKEDTYLRVAYTTSDSIRYFLNPILRYDGRTIGNRKSVARQ